MTAHARLFSRVSSRAVCEWTLERENEASISPHFKPSVEGNEFDYLKKALGLRQRCFRSDLSQAADGKWPLLCK